VCDGIEYSVIVYTACQNLANTLVLCTDMRRTIASISADEVEAAEVRVLSALSMDLVQRIGILKPV
jgi:hypothetical protein